MEDYSRLTEAVDPREAYETAGLPEAVRAELIAGLATNIAELAGDDD